MAMRHTSLTMAPGLSKTGGLPLTWGAWGLGGSLQEQRTSQNILLIITVVGKCFSFVGFLGLFVSSWGSARKQSGLLPCPIHAVNAKASLNLDGVSIATIPAVCWDIQVSSNCLSWVSLNGQ